jgi:polysaccharide export outer membrane protein
VFPGPDKEPAAPGKSEESISDSSLTKLGPGDLVNFGVYGVPEMETKARINNAGDLYLPLVDYVHVGDLTVEEAQKIIEKRLEDGGYVRNPHVTIFVTEYASQGVSVIGQVARPGIYPVLGERKLFDVLTLAGGLSERAGRTVTITHRDEPDAPETVELGRALWDKPETNRPVRPGDSIEVHRAPMIYVVGDVGRPSGLIVDSGSVTVLQAIALVGGPAKTAKLNDTRILRKVGVDGISQTKVPLKKMLQGKVPDMPLQANDIMVVPVSGGKILAARSFEAAMAISTSLAFYTIHP